MIKRSELATRSVAAFMSGVMLVTAGAGCVASADGDSTQEAAQRQMYDGQSAFRGAFFGEGPVAQILPEIWGEGAARRIDSASAIPPAELANQLEAAIATMKTEGWSEEQLAGAEHALETLRSGGTLPDRSADAPATRELVIARLAQRDPTFFDRFAVEMQSGDHIRVRNIVAETRGHLSEVLRTIAGENASGHGNSTEFGIVYKWAVYVVAVSAVVAAVAVLLVGLDSESLSRDTTRLGKDELIDYLTTQLGPS